MDSSFIDGLNLVFNRGADAAGRKAKAIACQGKIAQLETSKKGLFADLGHRVFEQERGNASFEAVYSEQVQAILSIEREQAELQAQIEELQRSDSAVANGVVPAGAPTGKCPDCGATVSVDSAFCPSCGGNLAALKASYRVCPQCGTYYDGGVAFCIKCGVKVEELPVREVAPKAEAVPVPSGDAAEGASAGPVSESLAENPAEVPEPDPVCPHCKKPVKATDRFCGSCGGPLD